MNSRCELRHVVGLAHAQLAQEVESVEAIVVDLNDFRRQFLAVLRQAAPQSHIFLVILVSHRLDDCIATGWGARITGV